MLYQNRLEQIATNSKLFCQNQNESCLVGKSDYESTLNNERKFKTLKTTWESWQNIYNSSDIEEFRNQLGLVKEAATLNGIVKKYPLK